MDIPEFSVIIASYDRHESLRRLLAGIANHFGWYSLNGMSANSIERKDDVFQYPAMLAEKTKRIRSRDL
jgi:hypothetical protein